MILTGQERIEDIKTSELGCSFGVIEAFFFVAVLMRFRCHVEFFVHLSVSMKLVPEQMVGGELSSVCVLENANSRGVNIKICLHCCDTLLSQL